MVQMVQMVRRSGSQKIRWSGGPGCQVVRAIKVFMMARVVQCSAVFCLGGIHNFDAIDNIVKIIILIYLHSICTCGMCLYSSLLSQSSQLSLSHHLAPSSSYSQHLTNLSQLPARAAVTSSASLNLRAAQMVMSRGTFTRSLKIMIIKIFVIEDLQHHRVHYHHHLAT